MMLGIKEPKQGSKKNQCRKKGRETEMGERDESRRLAPA
jgi:hypothetical protein